jgi:hypothetical protein
VGQGAAGLYRVHLKDAAVATLYLDDRSAVVRDLCQPFRASVELQIISVGVDDLFEGQLFKRSAGVCERISQAGFFFLTVNLPSDRSSTAPFAASITGASAGRDSNMAASGEPS